MRPLSLLLLLTGLFHVSLGQFPSYFFSAQNNLSPPNCVCQSTVNPLNPNFPNPNQPFNPNNPSFPTNPNFPGNPSFPSSPNFPLNPSPPVNPNQPFNPNFPNFPGTNPNQPFNPNNPSFPTNPNFPGNPSFPSNPNFPVNPSLPVNPNQPFNPNFPNFPGTNPNQPFNPNVPNINQPFSPNGSNFPGGTIDRRPNRRQLIPSTGTRNYRICGTDGNVYTDVCQIINAQYSNPNLGGRPCDMAAAVQAVQTGGVSRQDNGGPVCLNTGLSSPSATFALGAMYTSPVVQLPETSNNDAEVLKQWPEQETERHEAHTKTLSVRTDQQIFKRTSLLHSLRYRKLRGSAAKGHVLARYLVLRFREASKWRITGIALITGAFIMEIKAAVQDLDVHLANLAGLTA